MWLSVDEKAERVLLAQQLRTLCDAVCVSAAEAAELGGVAAKAKVRTVAQFVAASSGADPAPVRADNKIGRWLRSFPVFEEAFRAGEVTKRHLDKLEAAHSPKVHNLMISDQHVLLNAATTCDWKGFVVAIGYWLNAADPDGELPKEQLAKSGVRIKENPDGSIEGTFYFDALRGHAFKTAFDREVQRVMKSEAETDSNSETGTRSNYQRGADALINLVTRGHQNTTAGPIEPLINIVVGAETAAELIARHSGESTDPNADWPIDPDNIDRRCETITGTPIHPDFAMAAMSVGRFQRHIFKPDGRRIARSTKHRSFTRDQKHILIIESRGRCSTPGCDAPFAWLHADHKHPFSKRGQTSLDNGQAYCEPDNRWKADRTDLTSSDLASTDLASTDLASTDLAPHTEHEHRGDLDDLGEAA